MSDWYQIENSYLTVQLNSSGAEMRRLFAKPWNRDLLWNPQEEADKKIWARSAPVLFPIVGKLKEDAYSFQGKKYALSQHGFARDCEFSCTMCESGEASFLLEATQETYKYYPFVFSLMVNYKLEGKLLTISYTVNNLDRQMIYFSIGAHPGFVVTNPADYKIVFEKKEKSYFHLTDKKMASWKNPLEPESREMLITPELFKSDALIFKEMKSSHVDLVNEHLHETIRLHGTKTPYFGLWGKEHLPFICLEPWFGVSDKEEHDQNLETKEGIMSVKEGASFKFSYGIEILT